jgi:hypothetical protein
MTRRITTGRVGGAIGGVNITNTEISAAEDLDITVDPAGTGIFRIAGAALLEQQADLRFGDSDDSNYVGFQAPSTIATNVLWSLPAADGSANQLLSTNGSATLSWATPSVGITDNTSDSGTNYLAFTTATSGTITTARVSSTKLTFQPSTGTLTSVLLTINGNVASSSTSTGSIIVTGGVGLSGNLFSGGTVNDSKGEIREIPVNAQGGGYTLVAADHGKMIRASSTVTVPSGVFTAGQNISVYNNTAGNITVSQGSGVTLRQVGTANTGNRTLAQRGFVAIICVNTNEFVISGSGLS